MYYTKYSRKHLKLYTFHLDSFGYIRLEIKGGLNGYSLRQICENGEFYGETLICRYDESTFHKTVNKWYRKHIKNT